MCRAGNPLQREPRKAASTMQTISRTAHLNRILLTIKDLTGYMSRSHHELRHCARCGKALTDPASWERGIGPLCASKDTALFAKTIPANHAMVTMCALALKVERLPEAIRPVWSELVEVICENSERAHVAATNSAGFMLTGEDSRVVAKVIDWMLSFRPGAPEKLILIDIVKYLGFVGLAGVLSGKASTGEASIGFENGRLSLLGSSNKEGFREMRKIPGVTLPRYRGDRTPYTVPANQHAAFFAVALEFWPCFTGEVTELAAKCEAWIEAHPERVEVRGNYSNKPLASIVTRFDDFSLKFTWIAGVSPRVVADLKGNVPIAQRTYNAATYTWNFKPEAHKKVMEILRDHYSIEETVSTDPTPEGLFNHRPTSVYTGKSRNYRRSWSRG